MEWSNSSMFIYSPIVDATTVGDVAAPLLNVVPVDHRPSYTGTTCNYMHLFAEVKRTHYVSLCTTKCNTTRILFYNETGEKMKFTSGRVVVTLLPYIFDPLLRVVSVCPFDVCLYKQYHDICALVRVSIFLFGFLCFLSYRTQINKVDVHKRLSHKSVSPRQAAMRGMVSARPSEGGHKKGGELGWDRVEQCTVRRDSVQDVIRSHGLRSSDSSDARA